MAEHPAKFSPQILEAIEEAIADNTGGMPRTVLDPFAGIGNIHDLNHLTYAIEIEPEWAAVSTERGWTWVGNFFDFSPETSTFLCGVAADEGFNGVIGKSPKAFDIIATSPTYGNRMADNHTPGPGDTSKRLTYRHRLGRPLTPGSSAGMQWGARYKRFHLSAWVRCWNLLKPNGFLILNVKDHVRKGKLIPVSRWHREALEAIGFEVVQDEMIPVRGMGFGKNQTLDEGLKVDFEHVYVFRKKA